MFIPTHFRTIKYNTTRFLLHQKVYLWGLADAYRGYLMSSKYTGIKSMRTNYELNETYIKFLHHLSLIKTIIALSWKGLTQAKIDWMKGNDI